MDTCSKTGLKVFISPLHTHIFKDIKLENNVFSCGVDLTFMEEFVPLKLTIPQTFPKGKYKLECEGINETKEYEAKDLADAIYQAFEGMNKFGNVCLLGLECEEVREIAIGNMVTQTAVEPETPWTDETDMWMETGEDEETKVL